MSIRSAKLWYVCLATHGWNPRGSLNVRQPIHQSVGWRSRQRHDVWSLIGTGRTPIEERTARNFRRTHVVAHCHQIEIEVLEYSVGVRNVSTTTPKTTLFPAFPAAEFVTRQGELAGDVAVSLAATGDQ